jgi:hypothetical protein
MTIEEREELINAGMAMGKREMLLNIQRQLVAMKAQGKGDSLTLKHVNLFDQLVSIDETLFVKPEFESEVSADIRAQSKNIVLNTPC